MDPEKTNEYIDANFEEVFIKNLSKFIEIPNLSPAFDQEFYTNGLIDQAIEYVIEFSKSLNIEGLEHRFYKEEGKCPMLIFTYPGNGKKNVMFYGHLDKQPHMTEGWKEGFGPTKPVIHEDRLYGRGGADDGYVPFGVLLALKCAIEQGADIPRIVCVHECEEESGSNDLEYLLQANADLIQTPDVCICMDSGALDYNNVWLTTTLRGVCNFDMKVSIADQGCHSGLGGGIVPDTWRIIN